MSSRDIYEDLHPDQWISWTWSQYFQLEWWQRCGWAPKGEQ